MKLLEEAKAEIQWPFGLRSLLRLRPSWVLLPSARLMLGCLCELCHNLDLQIRYGWQLQRKFINYDVWSISGLWTVLSSRQREGQHKKNLQYLISLLFLLCPHLLRCCCTRLWVHFDSANISCFYQLPQFGKHICLIWIYNKGGL